jgi:hypothetical protein
VVIDLLENTIYSSHIINYYIITKLGINPSYVNVS